MADILTGIVVRTVGGFFTVDAGGKKYHCFGPKKLRYFEMDILVGDRVEFSLLHKTTRGMIERVLPRKNRFKRPEVANVDVVFAVIAPLPEPDMVLVDKIIINCLREKITPKIIVNKCDLNCKQLVEDISNQYKNVCEVLEVSTLSGVGMEKLKSQFQDHIVCLAGQSAVGKTSILNFLCENINNKIGELSQKINRGMHTTRYSQIFPAFGGYIVDTTGFSLVEVCDDIKSWELMLFYDDMMEFSHQCKYKMCTHIAEPDCGVKNAVEQQKFPKERYLRYVEIFRQLLEKEKNKYD